MFLCENENNALLNEMLYNFEEDIYQHNPTPTKTRVNAYGQYIYRGMTGSSLYSDIATPHALAIRDQLIAENILSLQMALKAISIMSILLYNVLLIISRIMISKQQSTL